jgi:hypothetical protein
MPAIFSRANWADRPSRDFAAEGRVTGVARELVPWATGSREVGSARLIQTNADVKRLHEVR